MEWQFAFVGLLLLGMIAVGVPIAFSAGIAGSVGLIMLNGFGALRYTLGTLPVSGLGNFGIVALPLFVLMGNLAVNAGVGAQAYQLARKLVGGVRGSLLFVTIIGCGFIGATTGTSATGTIIMAKLAYPEMTKYGYNHRLALGSIAAAGTVGIMIPPSAPMVLIGILGQESIARLFIAGVFPGILTVAVYVAMVAIRLRLNPEMAPVMEETAVGVREKVKALPQGIGVAVLAGSVMVPLYTGWATASETAALGVAVAFVLWLVAHKRKSSALQPLSGALWDAVKVWAMLAAFLVGASIFLVYVAQSNVIVDLVGAVKNAGISPRLTVGLILLAYLPLGMFLDGMSLIILTTPVVWPIVVSGLGFSGIWFAILMIKMIEISAATPPVGLGLFVTQGSVPGSRLEDVIHGVKWFVVADLVTVSLLFAFPDISLYLTQFVK